MPNRFGLSNIPSSQKIVDPVLCLKFNCRTKRACTKRANIDL